MPRPRKTKDAETNSAKEAKPAAESSQVAAATEPVANAAEDNEHKRKRAKIPQWREEFNNLLEIKKPEDPFDCLVKIGKDDRCDASKIQNGMLLDRPARLVILDASTGRVRNQELFERKVDSDWTLGSELFRKQCWSADHYTEIQELNKTQLAHKIKTEVGDTLCKVEFTKAPDVNEMAKLLEEGSKKIEAAADATPAEKHKAYKELAARLQKGEYRIMRGYIKRSEDMDIQQTDTGMVKFVDADLQAKGEMAERMLNLNNVTALTLRLVKYVLK